LLDLCCAKIASLCKDKSEEEVFKIFNITEDFTDEEREKIRKDNQWIEDNI
jgi:S-phase kinase-associated protein 1